MRIKVTHTIDRLARDCASIASTTKPKMARVVKRNVEQGSKLTQKIARAASGPHGRHYWKRISGEMTGVLEGEFGPHGDVAGNAVGGGWRNGPPNTDLEKALDIQGPKFAKDAGKILDSVFWP